MLTEERRQIELEKIRNTTLFWELVHDALQQVCKHPAEFHEWIPEAAGGGTMCGVCYKTISEQEDIMNIKVIGISGKSGTGKDHITQNFIRPHGFYQWSLAWHFKVGIVGKGLATHDEVFYTKPPHIRKELQLEGTERGRMVYGENLWCDTAREWMVLLKEQWGIDKFVIADVRFPNEVEFVQNMGGKVARIVAPKRAESNSLSTEARLHVSETALDDFTGFDHIINNDPDDSSFVSHQISLILNGLI